MNPTVADGGSLLVSLLGLNGTDFLVGWGMFLLGYEDMQNATVALLTGS